MVVKIKKEKDPKKIVIKRKLKCKDYKNCLKASQTENEINQLEKYNVNTDSFKEAHKEFIQNKKLTLKFQQRFKSSKHNVFTEEVNKIT